MSETSVHLPNGRVVSYAEYGDPSGTPIIYCHGIPGGSAIGIDPGVIAAGGARLFAVERAGFGSSDPAPGHTLLDAAADIVATADLLDLDRFAMLGVSAGAPNALACAARHQDRVAVVGIGCGVGPIFDQPRFDALLQAETQALLPFARADIAATRDLLRAVAEPIAEQWGADPVALFETMLADAPPADHAEMVRSRDWVLASLEATYRRGPDTWVDEVVASLGPWEFDPTEVAVPVHLWHGDSDQVAPVEIAEWLTGELPQATLTVYPGEGHFLSPAHHADWIEALTRW